ncbi:hypothetical protein BDF19DRAFT_438687 [Syncephalis fuscata]|nr:hypothetical protein BDF19DRAFT_438687 [Syncephalis fuscata]
MSRKSKSKKSTAPPAAAAPEAASTADQSVQADEQEVEQKGHGAQATKDMGDMVSLLADMQSGELELSKTEKALKDVRNTERERKAARMQSQVEVNKQTLEDSAVEFIMNEFELTRPVAEQKLCLYNGDMNKTLQALLSANKCH